MNEFWQQLIAIILAPTLTVAAIAWLLKGIISQGFQRDLEKFKSDLAQKNYEQQQKFSLIHQKQADIIANLYSKFAKTKGLVADLVGIFQQGGQSLMDKKKNVAESYNDMASYFFQNKLFLTSNTAERCEKLVDELRSALIEFDTAQMGNDEYKPDNTGLWVQAYKRVRDDIPPILKDLEFEFKQILGIIENP